MKKGNEEKTAGWESHPTINACDLHKMFVVSFFKFFGIY